MVSLLILAIMSLLLWYSIVIFNQLMRHTDQLQAAFSQVEVQLNARYQQIQQWSENSRHQVVDHHDAIELVMHMQLSALGQLKVAANNPADKDAIQQLIIADAKLQSNLDALNNPLNNLAGCKIGQLRQELQPIARQLHMAQQQFNLKVDCYNRYRHSFPALLLTGVFGHQSDASLLLFDHLAHVQSTPQYKGLAISPAK